MGLADRFSAYEKPRMGARCTTCHLEMTLPKDDADALMKALADPSVSNSAISEILKSEGYQVGETSIRRHRKGMCKGHGSE